jgi:Zn-dependent protease
MNLFRIRGIQLAVHFSFLLLLLFVAWEGWAPDAAGVAGGWLGVFWNVVTLLAFFTCVVLHELGHSFTAMHYGIGVRRILLMPIGGMAEFDRIPRQPSRELLITLAGPAVNFAIAGFLALLVKLPPGWPVTAEYTADLSGLAQLLLTWNLAMGCFNLVPVFPMDGGRIFRAALATRLPYVRATFVAATVGKVLAAAAAFVAAYFFQATLTVALFAFIFFVGEMEYRAVKRRESDDAHWRAMLARLYAPPPPAEDPPLLTR